MTELFIRIVNGQPFEHPILGVNFKQAFPDVDVNNLPPEFARFERVPRPDLGTYEVWVQENSTYELIDGVYKNVWHKRLMTAEEKMAKQQAAKDDWESHPQANNWAAWVFDEASCTYMPPVPKPAGNYFWCGSTESWVEWPPYPTDGKEYDLDYFNATWVEVTQT